MYHDKRFQLEPLFPLVALNHEQIKNSTTAGYLLADKKRFEDIANRLLTIKESTLTNLIDRLREGPVKPETEEEKQCFKLLSDIDHVSYKVQGSVTSKKYMRNEVWSLIAFNNTPDWFITFSPADNKHPICLHWASKDIKFQPEIKSSSMRELLATRNPVACARFFDHMVQLFQASFAIISS